MHKAGVYIFLLAASGTLLGVIGSLILFMVVHASAIPRDLLYTIDTIITFSAMLIASIVAYGFAGTRRSGQPYAWGIVVSILVAGTALVISTVIYLFGGVPPAVTGFAIYALFLLSLGAVQVFCLPQVYTSPGQMYFRNFFFTRLQELLDKRAALGLLAWIGFVLSAYAATACGLVVAYQIWLVLTKSVLLFVLAFVFGLVAGPGLFFLTLFHVAYRDLYRDNQEVYHRLQPPAYPDPLPQDAQTSSFEQQREQRRSQQHP